MSLQSVSYNVDIALCIDSTGSMSPVLDDVKSAALGMYAAIEKKMGEKGKRIDSMRIRVIGFRDFYDKDAPAVEQMPDFVDLRTGTAEFEKFVRSLKPTGGGDEPENGLEALALALNSSWVSASQAKARHIIVFWTDASAHNLERSRSERAVWPYPSGMPSTFDDLTELWSSRPAANKRLVLYAPECEPWSVIGSHWDNVIYFPSIAGAGLQEFEFDEILNTIANSM